MGEPPHPRTRRACSIHRQRRYGYRYTVKKVYNIKPLRPGESRTMLMP